MPRFYNAKREFSPTYGGIDWAEVLKTHEGKPSKTSVWFDSDDGLNQECTQENTDLFLNQICDDADALLVYDPRDEKRYSFFRNEIGFNQFTNLSQQLQELGSAAVHFTMYPMQEIAELWSSRQQRDLSISDFVPDDWMQL